MGHTPAIWKWQPRLWQEVNVTYREFVSIYYLLPADTIMCLFEMTAEIFYGNKRRSESFKVSSNLDILKHGCIFLLEVKTANSPLPSKVVRITTQKRFMLYTRGLQMFIENAIKRQVWTLAYAKQVRLLPWHHHLLWEHHFTSWLLHFQTSSLPRQLGK